MGPNRPIAAEVEDGLAVAADVAAALASRDSDAIERLFHPEVEFHDAWALGPGIYRGHQGMRQLYADVASVWENFSFEVVELEPAPGGRVFMAARQGLRRKGTSRQVDRTMYFLLELRDGKLVRWDGWHLRSVARGAAGLTA